MFFNSIDFAIFLPIVFFLYWFVFKSHLKLQNLLILIASYVFYGWWDWRFLTLIFFSTVVDYVVGIRLSRTEDKKIRKLLLAISITVNLGLLGFFKYYNFFIETFVDAFSIFGYQLNANTLNIILPVGISFYTFQTLSYSIDIYKRRMEFSKDFIAFASFVSFFPQLVAGPIERATNLLPQFHHKRSFDSNKALDGVRQILWGLFKKVVIADSCAVIVDGIFSNYHDYSGLTLFAAAVLFAFQIYGDFSGYSDIAIGTSRLFGFNLMQNFAFPYFSRDIAEFWRRWHISLSTWFRDYLYIPLGGSKGGRWMQVRNTFIIFIVSGFWHGANWTFIAWGALNAIYFLPLLLLGKNRRNLGIVAENRVFPTLKEIGMILFTFLLTVVAWVFFRSASVTDALSFLKSILSFSSLNFAEADQERFEVLKALLTFFLLIEWWGRKYQFGLQVMEYVSYRLLKVLIYSFIIYCLMMFLKVDGSAFIYFQF